MGSAFCGCRLLRVGSTEGTGQVEWVQATWKHHAHTGKHSPGTLPFPVLQAHEIFRLLDAVHPLLSPQQGYFFLYIIYGCPLSSPQRQAEQEKADLKLKKSF